MDIFKSGLLIDKGLKIESLTTEKTNRILRIEVSKDSLRMVRFKNDVYSQYVYLTSLSEMLNESNQSSRYVYLRLNQKQEVLDDVRVRTGNESLDFQRMNREMFLKGILSIYYLVSHGKIYNVPIHPLNLIVENKTQVKAFYRDDAELGTVTDEWLTNLKKLIAYYLIYDTDIIPEKFHEYSLQDLIVKMSSGTKQGFLRFYNCRSVDEMLPLYLSNEEISALTYTYPLSDSFHEPEDISTGTIIGMEEAVLANSVHIEIEEQERLKESLSNQKKLDKKKLKKGEKRKKERENVIKKREKQLDKKEKKVKKGFEPNEAKRKTAEYNKRKKKEGFSFIPALFIFIIVIGLMAGLYFLQTRPSATSFINLLVILENSFVGTFPNVLINLLFL